MKILEDYTLYHKVVIVIMTVLVLALGVHALTAIKGRVTTVSYSVILPYEAGEIWPYIYDPSLRDNWIVRLYDHAKLAGEPLQVNSSRILFWKNGPRKWHTEETTLSVVPSRHYRTYHSNNRFEANMDLRLNPIGPCQTEVIIESAKRYSSYADRLTAPLETGEIKDTLKQSLDALNRWAGKDTVCVQKAN